MAATNFTPISLYYSTTASAVPLAGNLVAGELALNTLDEKLYFKNSAGTVKLLASNATSAPVLSFSAGTTGFTPSTATTGAVTLAGTLATTNGGTGLTSFTSGGVPYATSTSALTTGSALTFNGTTLSTTGRFTTTSTATNDIFVATAATTNTKYIQIANTSGNFYAGVESSAGGSILSAATAYSTSIAGAVGLNLSGNASTVHAKIDTSGNFLIGTTSNANSDKLVVNGQVYQFQTSNGSSASPVTNGGYLFGPNSSTIYAGIRFINQILSNNNTAMAFYTTSNAGSAAEVARFDGTGQLGIGTTTPRGKVDVNGTLLVAGGGQIQITGSVSSTGLQLLGQDAAESAIGTMSSQALAFRTASSEKARFSSAGGFSVGTTADPGAGAIYATGNITAYYSDERLKDVKGRITNALAKVRRLSGVYYTNNETAKSFGYTSDEMQVGVLANQMKGELPEIVKPAPFDLDEHGNSKSGENYMTVQYERGLPLLIEALKELADQFDDYVATH